MVKGQIPVNRSPSSVQVRDARLQAYLNLIAPRYSDTAHANTNKGLDSLGAIIYDSTSNNFYFRGVNASMGHKWIAFGSGSGGGNTIYTADDVITGARTLTMPNGVVQFYAPNIGASAEFDLNIQGAASGTYFARGTGTAQQYTSSATTTNGFNETSTYAEIFGLSASTHRNSIRTYGDSLIFNSYNGTYRFRNLNTVGDSAIYKPGGYDALGNFVRLSYWPGGTAAGRTFYGRNGLRMRDDSTFTWNGALDTPTLITGGSVNTLRFSGVSGGVKFDENPTFNTTSTAGQVWTASNSIGGGQWQNASTGLLTRQNITSGTSGTVTAGNYLVTINPSSTMATYTLTLPASPNDQDAVEVDFGGTLTSGLVVTSLTILPNSSQTILDNTPPGSATVDNTLRYVYRTSTAAWRRIKL